MQAENGLQSVFDEPDGFLNRTVKYYVRFFMPVFFIPLFLQSLSCVQTMHLALAAKSVYFVEGNYTVSSVEISQVLRLWIKCVDLGFFFVNKLIYLQPIPGAYPISAPLCLWIHQRVATPHQQAATAEPVPSCAAWDHCGRRLVDFTLRVW